MREGQGVEVIGEWLGAAVGLVSSLIPEQSRFPLGGGPEGGCRQKLIMDFMNTGRRDRLVAGSGVWDKARLESAAAPHAGCWLEAPPGLAFEMQLTNGECSIAWRAGLVYPYVMNMPAHFA